MTSVVPPRINPFAIPGADTEPVRPLNPWQQPEHEQYYIDLDSTESSFQRFTREIGGHIAPRTAGRLVLTTGDTGCGKTALVNRCVHWLAGQVEGQGRHVTVVDLRTVLGPAGAVMTMLARTTAVSAMVLERLDRWPQLPADTERELLRASEQGGASFFAVLDRALRGIGQVCVLLLPDVEDLLPEVTDYANIATAVEAVFFFSESTFLGPDQLTKVRTPFIELHVGQLRPGDVRRFTEQRLHPRPDAGTFPVMSAETIERIAPVLRTAGQLQRALYLGYQRRLERGDRYTEHDRITVEDITRAVLDETQTGGATAPQPTSGQDGPDDAQPRPGSIGTDVDWSTDAPATIDLLRRDTLAKVLADQMYERRRNEPGTSLLVHVDGAWGSGKSTLLRLLGPRLRAAGFLIVEFDAWQQSRLSPPWWSLLTALRQVITADRHWWARWWLRLREMWARIRRSGAPYLLALILLLLLAGGLGLAVRFAIGSAQPGTNPFEEVGKTAATVLTVLGVLWTGARAAGRVLLWNSAGGARLFERSDANPMGLVAAHFGWLLARSRRPVVFFVDDLDRCRNEYVVELLDSVQTLIRATGRAGAQAPPAAYFVVAADGFWLRQSYATAYSAFREATTGPAGRLGYQFMDKLFQLTIPMPALSDGAQREYLGHLLHVPSAATADTDGQVQAAKLGIAVATGNEQHVLQRMADIQEPRVRDAVAGDAAIAVSAPSTREHTEHKLREFAPLLSRNPRQTKLFLNTYSILRAVRLLEGTVVPPDVLALWSIIRVRWPDIADHLQRDPEAVRGIHDPLWCSESFPEELRETAGVAELRRVVDHPAGGPLTANMIRLCCGSQ